MESSELSKALQVTSSLTLDQCITSWLAAKIQHTGSVQTRRAYTTIIEQFRATLHSAGLELTSDATLIATLAQGWASVGQDGAQASSSTFNQRLSILSSFYKYAKARQICMANPIDLVERQKRKTPNAALPMEASEVADRLSRIDCTNLEGMRDHTLLTVAVMTGRRASELASLRWSDLRFTGKQRQTIVITWQCKGNEVMTDELHARTTERLLQYLHAVYGADLGSLTADAPIWVSLSNNNYREAITDQAIADICKDRLGTSKVHTLRHTFAVAMDEAGAPLSEISKRLGHKDLKTTSIYLERLRSAKNPYGKQLEDMFGI